MAGEEVTGLHAFDDLDPVSTVSALNAMPDPDEISGRTEVPLTRTTPPGGRLKMPPPSRAVSGLPPPPLPRVSGSEHAADAGALFAARPSAPPPPPQSRAGRSSLSPPPPPRAGSAAVTLSISPQFAQPERDSTLGEQDEIAPEGDEDTKVVPNAFTHDPEYAPTAAFVRPEGDPAASEAFGEASDDQRTSVKDAVEIQSTRAGNGIDDNELLELSATTVATNIDMDWDEEEVETKLRDEGGMHEVSPGALVLPLVGGRPSPFPSVAAAPIGRGGQPSPFAARSFRPATGDERNDGSWEDADEALTRVMPSAWSPSMPPSAGAEITGTRQLAERFPWLSTATTLVGGDRRVAGNRLAWLGFAAVALIAFAVAARALVSGRQLATVTLATKPVDALVLVDDSPLTGQTSPFTIQGLKPGIEHTVEVRKDGFATQSHRFRVAAGEVKPLPTIELAGQRVDTGFALASLPAGAAVYIDGHKLEQPTPVRIADLAQGLHVVRLEYGSAYQPWETQVALATGQVIELPTARLVPASPSSGGSFVGTGTVSRNAEVQAPSNEGSSGHHRAEVREPKAERTPVMQPAMRASAPMRAPVSAPSGFGFTGQSGSQASLRLNSRPWSQIFIDGRMVGNTPQLNLPLPAGHHKVKLVNPQLGMSKAFSVDLKAGKVVTKVVDLQ